MTPAAVAQSMQVAPATVKSHIKHVMAKLGAHSREEAIRSPVSGSASEKR